MKKNLGAELVIDAIYGNIPWHHSLDNAGNSAFLEVFSGKAGKQANYFTVLGWETGLLVSIMLQLYKDGQPGGAGIINSMKNNTTWDSPRRWIRIDPQTQYTYGPSYQATCSGNLDTVITGETDIDSAWNEFINQPPLQGESSGWRNTYLCV